MSETACMDWQFSPHASRQSAQETSDEIPSDAINTPASTTRDSHDATAQASLPQTPPPSNAPFGGLLSQRVLELISLHQITLDHRADPMSYITTLRTFREEHFVRRLVVQIEDFLLLPPRYELALEDRIQDVKQWCDLLECPRHERPNGCQLDTQAWICEAERYETTQISYPAWHGEDVQIYALVYLSQSFGRLHYTPPTDLCPDAIPSAAALLISLHERRREQYGIRSFTPTISLELRNPGFLEVLGPYCQLRKDKTEIPATNVDLQHIQEHGGSFYIQQLRQYCIQKHGKSQRVEDVELRDYKELARIRRGDPLTGMSVSQLIERLQVFQEAWTDLKDWSEEDMPNLTWLYVVRLLAILGFKVSMNDFLRDPRRLLEIISFKLQSKSQERDEKCSPETPLSSTHGYDVDESSLCWDTESQTDGEEDDDALNGNMDTDDHMNDDNCYRLLELPKDGSRHLTLRVFGLWVSYQGLQVEEGRVRRAERILCAWRTFANLLFSSGLYGVIEIIESQLLLVPLSEATKLERVSHCETQLRMECFSLLRSGSPDDWVPLKKAVKSLSHIPRYEIQGGEISKVLTDAILVRVYLAGCLAKLGYVFPENGEFRSYEIANKLWDDVCNGS